MKVTYRISREKETLRGKELDEALKKAGWYAGQAGYFAGRDFYPDGTDTAAVAAMNEYGDANRPARPFLRESVDRHREEIGEKAVKESERMLSGEIGPHWMFANLANFQTGLIKEEISSGSFAPLSPATVRAKGHSKPLQDTGRLKLSAAPRVIILGEDGQ